MSRPRALRELTLMRLRTFLREPEALFWTFVFPILMAVGLGIAFGGEGSDPVPVAVVEGSAGQAFEAALRASPDLEVKRLPETEAVDALRRSEIDVAIGGTDSVTFHFDPTRPESRTARLIADQAIQSAAGATRPVAVRLDARRQAGSRYIDWVIPGLIGLNLMSTGLWGIGFGIVTMRQKKQLKRMIATPMNRADFLLAQIGARLGFVLLEVPPLLIFAWFVFRVRNYGSWLDFSLVVLLGTAVFAALGLLVSSRARTIEGVSGLMNVVMLPMFILSGVFFSARRFPEVLQPFVQILPLTALNDAMRAVFNEGRGLGTIPGELLILALWTVGSAVLALRLFRWR